MERERWEKVYRLLVALDTHAFRGVFQAAAVLAVYFWAVIHDRPVSWACQRVNWTGGVPFCKLPSQPTMSRRLRQPDVLALLTAVGERQRREHGRPDAAGAERPRRLRAGGQAVRLQPPLRHCCQRRASTDRGAKASREGNRPSSPQPRPSPLARSAPRPIWTGALRSAPKNRT